MSDVALMTNRTASSDRADGWRDEMCPCKFRLAQMMQNMTVRATGKLLVASRVGAEQ